MASSTIKQQQPVLSITDDAITFNTNTDFCQSTNVAQRRYGNIVQFRLEFWNTQGTWGANSELFVGGLNGHVPQMVTYVPCMRQSGDLFVGWLKIGGSQTTGTVSCNLTTLSTLPAGVVVVASGTYICN